MESSRQRHMVENSQLFVMEVTHKKTPDGQFTFESSFKEYYRSEILAIARGVYHNVPRKRHTEANSAHSLVSYRDLDHFTMAATDISQGKSVFRMRKGCILFALSSYKAIITHERVLIFPESGADEELLDLVNMIQTFSEQHVSTTATTDVIVSQSNEKVWNSNGSNTGYVDKTSGGSLVSDFFASLPGLFPKSITVENDERNLDSVGKSRLSTSSSLTNIARSLRSDSGIFRRSSGVTNKPRSNASEDGGPSPPAARAGEPLSTGRQSHTPTPVHLVTSPFGSEPSEHSPNQTHPTAPCHSFEYIILSCLFRSVSKTLQKELEELFRDVSKVISRRSHVTDAQTQRIQEMEESLSEYVTTSERMLVEISGVLEEEEDVQSMVLSIPRTVAVDVDIDQLLTRDAVGDTVDGRAHIDMNKVRAMVSEEVVASANASVVGRRDSKGSTETDWNSPIRSISSSTPAHKLQDSIFPNKPSSSPAPGVPSSTVAGNTVNDRDADVGVDETASIGDNRTTMVYRTADEHTSSSESVSARAQPTSSSSGLRARPRYDSLKNRSSPKLPPLSASLVQNTSSEGLSNITHTTSSGSSTISEETSLLKLEPGLEEAVHSFVAAQEAARRSLAPVQQLRALLRAILEMEHLDSPLVVTESIVKEMEIRRDLHAAEAAQEADLEALRAADEKLTAVKEAIMISNGIPVHSERGEGSLSRLSQLQHLHAFPVGAGSDHYPSSSHPQSGQFDRSDSRGEKHRNVSTGTSKRTHGPSHTGSHGHTSRPRLHSSSSGGHGPSRPHDINRSSATVNNLGYGSHLPAPSSITRGYHPTGINGSVLAALETGEVTIENQQWKDHVVLMEELLEWITSEIEHNLGQAKFMQGQLAGERKKLTILLATNRNKLMLVQVGVQTATLGMAMCSMISGFFGMNLYNGVCGPEGCGDHSDQGKAAFILIACISVSVGFFVSIIIFMFSRRYAGG